MFKNPGSLVFFNARAIKVVSYEGAHIRIRQYKRGMPRAIVHKQWG